MVLSLEIMPLEERAPEPVPPKTIVVRYGFLRDIGEFQSDLKTKVGCGSKLVIRTNRGTEIAEMLTTVCGNGGCGKSITRDKLLDYISQSGGDKFPFSEAGRVLRVATAQDLAQQRRLDEQKPAHLTMARELVHQHKIPMKMVDIEYLLGGERILFYFTSEHRVDFRSLVRELVQRVHTRIELCQVGARDEARLVADYDKCGQHCCCKQFLKVLTPISMRSAKVQRATLDPVKINGRCGRLMCCLRYEDQTYEELRKKLPPKNSRLSTAQGEAWVIDSQILTQLVLVQYDDGSQVAVPMENIEAFNLPKPKLPSGRAMQFPGDFDRTAVPPGTAPAAPGPVRRGPQNPGQPQKPGAPANRGPGPRGPQNQANRTPQFKDNPKSGPAAPSAQSGPPPQISVAPLPPVAEAPPSIEVRTTNSATDRIAPAAPQPPAADSPPPSASAPDESPQQPDHDHGEQN